MASPTAVSAAATTITKNTNTCPLSAFHWRGESHKSQVHGVQHQLDRHEDGDHVALDEKAGDSAGKQDRRQHQVIGNRHHQSFPLRARTTAPMMAIRISSDVTSNGSRNSLKISRPSPCGRAMQLAYGQPRPGGDCAPPGPIPPHPHRPDQPGHAEAEQPPGCPWCALRLRR